MDWKRKLTSRKMWMAIATFVAMLIVALGGSEQEASQVTALIMAGAAAVAYIIGEGFIDAKNKTDDSAGYEEYEDEDYDDYDDYDDEEE